MSNIIKTLKLIEDRFSAIEDLRKLVFVTELKANERDHLQKFIQEHFWIFGEQYTLLTAEEPDFTEALRRYRYFKNGDPSKPLIDDPNKNKEMDIFMVRQQISQDHISMQNMVVELKSPRVSIGRDEVEQVKEYFETIMNLPEFNENAYWCYYLVGNKYANNSYIKREFENAANHGEKSLIFKADNHKIYVKTWSEVFDEFKIKHHFIQEKLKLQINKSTETRTSADEIIAALPNNSAAMPGQLVPPKNNTSKNT